MSISRLKALDHAESIVNRPRGETNLVLRCNKNGFSLLHNGRVLTKTHASKVGQLQANALAMVLGIELPQKIGDEITASVATGVLYRAISASCLDLRKNQALIVLNQLLSTAALQRGIFKTLEIN